MRCAVCKKEFSDKVYLIHKEQCKPVEKPKPIAKPVARNTGRKKG